jgi:threonine/homoserine/homoserine lactone efflux protein
LLADTRSVDTGRMDGLFVALGIAGGVVIVAVAYLVIK